jgi:2-oxoglutarate ferredoxin oxidoreductase subunit delta
MSLQVKGMEEKKEGYYHIIREKYCKGCGICIAFCPKKLLVLKNGKVFPERPEICIGCHMCEYRCPDFAIEVRPIEDKTENDNAVEIVDLSLPPEAIHG